MSTRKVKTEVEKIELFSEVSGLNSNHKYFVIAINGDNKVLVKKNYYDPLATKIKFYPDIEAWNLTEDMLVDTGATNFAHREKEGYSRYILPKKFIKSFLEKLKEMNPKSKVAKYADLEKKMKEEEKVKEEVEVND